MRGKIKKTAGMLLGAVLLLCAGGCSLARSDEPTSCEKGMEALEIGDYTTAIGEFQNAVRIDGETAAGYRGQGIVYLREANYYYAITMFNRCLEELSGSEEDREMRTDVLLYKADACRLDGQTDDAREICDGLIQEGEGEAQALILRGEILADQGSVPAKRDEIEAYFA